METRNCQNCKKDFILDQNDLDFYNDRMHVPLPTWCPECRMIRRFMFRNERNLFRHRDARTNEEIFSGFPPETNVRIYDNNYWFGGGWDSLDSGVEYDFSRPFFDQLRELMSQAPLPAKSVINMYNSDYCNEASESKNSYLCFNTDHAENCGYLVKSTFMKDSFDCYEVDENELCYEDVMLWKSYRTFFSVDCESCVDVWFSKGLHGCTNCFGCVNLKGKSNYFFNEPLSKEAYTEKVRAFMQDSHSAVEAMKKQIADFWIGFPNKYYHGLRNVDSSGDRISDSKSVRDSFSVQGGEYLRYCQMAWPKASNSHDCTIAWEGTDNMYECVTCGGGTFNIKFSLNSVTEIRDLEYCIYCLSSSNCFGCVGLQKKEYCIFNKQYTKEEYFDLKKRIIEHMDAMPYVDAKGRTHGYGEFFPLDFSPIAYNESLAQDFIPIDKETAEQRGYMWREANPREFQTTVNAEDLPDSIKEAKDDIIKEVIACAGCKRAYRIIPIELQFLRKIGLPLPRLCHNCRFIERFKQINKPELYYRSCMCEKEGHEHSGKCQIEFETSYAPSQPDIVYCEQCFQKEVN